MDEIKYHKDFEVLLEKWEEQGYEALTDREKKWFNIESLLMSLNDGGIISYYYNFGVEHFEDIETLLKEENLNSLLKALKKIHALFPGGEPPKDLEKLNDIMESWDKKKIDHSDVFEEVDELFFDKEDVLNRLLEKIY